MKIDLVIPYVDSTDPNWQKVFFENSPTKNGEETAKNRFRSQGDFFRYFFRCIDKNMPWINNVFLLVQSESQVPQWLDKTKIKIITHDQFMPKKYLPTFNSGAIEMFLQNIPGLAEHFIYTNDDIYVLKPVNETDFFKDDYCIFNYLSDSDVNKNDWRQMCQNNHDLIFGTKHAIPFLRLDHEFRPYRKSYMQNCYKKFEPEILQSVSMFRSPKNLTVYLFSLDLIKQGKQKNTAIKSGYLCSTSAISNISKQFNTMDSICLNDTSTERDIYTNKLVRWLFWSSFSNKSKYELYDTNSLEASKPVAIKEEESRDGRADGQPNAFLYF